MTTLLDTLQGMYGSPDEDPIDRMLRQSLPDPTTLDADTISATSPDMSQPTDLHPDTLELMRRLDQIGTAPPQQPSAPKGMTAAQRTVTSEEGGLPPEQRALGVAVRGQAEIGDALVDRDRMNAMADELERRAAYLRQDAAIEHEQRQQAERENAERQARLRSQQLELAGQADEPINPNRYFQNMSAFSKAAAIIHAGIYGYLGGRGQPPVMDSLMQMAQQDVQAQLSDRQAARATRNSLIEQYERQYGDTTLVAKRLEADKLLTLSKETEARGMDAKTDEARANAQDMTKKLQNRVGVLHREIQEATYGKPVQVSTMYKATGGGGIDPMKALKLREEMEKGGYSQEAIAAELKKRGMAPPTGPSAYATESARKERDQAIQEAKLRELNPTEKQKLVERIDGLANATQGFEELDRIAGIARNKDGEVMKVGELVQGEPGVREFIDTAAGSLPFGMGEGAQQALQLNDPEELKALRRAAEKITSGMAHAESGAGISDKELQRYANRLPITGASSFKNGSAELFREQRQQYRNLVGQYGKAAVDEMLRKRGIDPSLYGGAE